MKNSQVAAIKIIQHLINISLKGVVQTKNPPMILLELLSFAYVI